VARRTLQLEEARQRAEVATRAKSAFLANVSHEILTPMNAILGLTHILRRGLPTPEQADKLGKIAAAAEHLLSIINNVLDLSRIETGKLVLANTNFSLESVLNHTRSMIAETARIKGIALNVDCAGLPSWLRGDPTRLRQALLIFAGNAVKFTHHGSISLRARLVEANDRGAPEAATGDAEDKLLIRFEVEDTGVGIPADKLSGLFQPFVQVDASSTRKYGGTGIGLAISRLLATEMGGDVGVESQVGRGSTFWMTARLSRGQDVAPPVLAPADLPANSSAESLLRHHHRNALVLLAEDNEISQETTLELIYAVGLNADTAANGREAVARAATVPYDLILMNTRMPLLNGLDAAREIRAQASTAATPILAITASDFDNDRVACQEAGINDFIHKPISPSMFYDTLLKWLPKPAPPSAVVEQTHDMPANKENLQQRLTAIRGLDLESGLAILRGDVGKYARLLKLFADSYRNRSKLIHGALAKGEIASLESIAHSLRGSASMLGAQSVSETANSVLLAVRGGQMDDAARFGAVLAEQLSTLIDDILHAVSDSPEADEPAPIHTRLPIVLAQLEEHLAHGDLAATYLATEEAPLLRAVLGEAAQSLIGHIDAFEYEEAATELSRILRQLNAVPIESAPPSPEGTR
ncbi:MAG: response regulator, partial [Polynucleobacter sp.]|nr:response regulator [Polynucleobacter sp.]